MSPIDELHRNVVEQLTNIMETIRSPRFLFFAFVHSFIERLE